MNSSGSPQEESKTGFSATSGDKKEAGVSFKIPAWGFLTPLSVKKHISKAQPKAIYWTLPLAAERQRFQEALQPNPCSHSCCLVSTLLQDRLNVITANTVGTGVNVILKNLPAEFLFASTVLSLSISHY